MRYLLFLIFAFSLLYSNHNKTKELENWLKLGFTNGDISFIVNYLQELEKKNMLLEKRVSNLESTLLEQNKILKNLLLAKKSKIKKDQLVKKRDSKTKIEKFKPSVFITIEKALLYDKPNGKALMEFKKGYKFTAYLKSNGFIKVSGHFPNKRWRSVKRTLWIKEELVKKIK